MAITLFRIKKWSKMLLGTSTLHTHQGVGRCMSATAIEGYYNDFTAMLPSTPSASAIPMVYAGEDGKRREFAIAVFQHGLGYYDQYLLQHDPHALAAAIECAEWALTHQQPDGAWDSFGFLYLDAPYSAMAQGEGISLLARAWMATHDERYLVAAQAAYTFLLEGGVTTRNHAGEMLLHEYTNMSPVLNGWVFALWGVWDYCLLFPNDDEARQVRDEAIGCLAQHLADFENGHWTNYNLDGSILASPHYQRIHVAQMKALYVMTHNELFRTYAERWEKWMQNPLCKYSAFVKKALQKIRD